MDSYDRILALLPTLYRPDAGDEGLFVRFLESVAQRIDDLDVAAANVLQSHWFSFADRARFDPYFTLDRARRGLPPAREQPRGDQQVEADRDALEKHPYIRDLARLGALLSIEPWHDPPAHRDTVDTYRERIRRLVALYRNGLGTVPAMHRMVEAQLPVDLDAPDESRDQPFSIEEFAPFLTTRVVAQTERDGERFDEIGPLMRWTLTNPGLAPVAPALYVEALSVVPQRTVPATDPVIELYSTGERYPRLGLAFRDTIPPGQTLRLRPVYESWIGLETGLAHSRSEPTADTSGDPTSPGPWTPAAGAPAAPCLALVQAPDMAIWLAVEDAGGSALWRFDGTAWTQELTTASARTLTKDGLTLLIGTDSGLLRLPLFPEDGVLAAAPVPGLETASVRAMEPDGRGGFYVGTDDGVMHLDSSGTVEPFVLRPDESTATRVNDVYRDPGGAFYFAAELGVFQYHPGFDHWYWYSGEEASDQIPDWQRFRPEASDERNFPTEERVFLPPVRCVFRGGDASLWFGTEEGIARYVAKSVGGLAYDTRLEAFPDVGTGAVLAIREDARGGIWFLTEQGVLRFDGRDFWQFRADHWTALGRADRYYGGTLDGQPRDKARFNRSQSRWERFDEDQRAWMPLEVTARATDEPSVRFVTWTDGVVADLGDRDGERFSTLSSVDSTLLTVRFKPDETRILTGGRVAVPRLPPGTSVWRYLSLEPAVLPTGATRPAWTIEGRLLPEPSNREAPWPGRYDKEAPPPPPGDVDRAVFAFLPAARITFEYEAHRPLSTLVRIESRSDSQRFDPLVLERVWQGIQKVRPAGIRTMLAIDEKIVRGRDDGTT